MHNKFGLAIFFCVIGLMSCSKDVPQEAIIDPTIEPTTIEFTYKGVNYRYHSDLSDADEATLQILSELKKNDSLAQYLRFDGTTEYFDSYEDLVKSFPPPPSSSKVRQNYGYISAKLEMFTNINQGGTPKIKDLTQTTTYVSEDFPVGDTFYNTISSMRVYCNFNNGDKPAPYVYLATLYSGANYTSTSFSLACNYLMTGHALNNLTNTPDVNGLNWNDRVKSYIYCN